MQLRSEWERVLYQQGNLDLIFSSDSIIEVTLNQDKFNIIKWIPIHSNLFFF